MRDHGLYLLILLAFGITIVNCSRILIAPFCVHSHINLFTKLGKALHDEGHEVSVLTYDEFKGDIEKRGLNPITFPIQRENDIMKELEERMDRYSNIEELFNDLYGDQHWLLAISRVCHYVMQNEYLMTTIGKKQFDLFVFDGVEHALCFLLIPYKFDIPFITVHGFQTTSWVAGVTGMPSIEPEINGVLSNKMNFWQRIENLKSWLNRYNNMYFDLYSDHMESYCPAHKPKVSLKQLSERAEMFLINMEIMCLDYPRVSAPNLQYLGASSATPPKPLPADLAAYLESAEHGIVLMSLGSMKSSQYVWKTIGQKLFKAFGRLPQRIIVQYRLDTVYGEVPPNVKIMKWLPQNDILGHPNVKLFVMHGGNNGQNEAAYHGVPMLVIPVTMDQPYCGERVAAHGYGNYVRDKKSITSDELFQMMTEIITNGSYSTNIKKCSAIMHSMPTATETFVFWVNHILKFGGAHLRPPSLDMPLYQVLMLDILAYYLVMFLVAIHAIIIIAFYFGKYFLNFFKPKKE